MTLATACGGEPEIDGVASYQEAFPSFDSYGWGPGHPLISYNGGGPISDIRLGGGRVWIRYANAGPGEWANVQVAGSTQLVGDNGSEPIYCKLERVEPSPIDLIVYAACYWYDGTPADDGDPILVWRLVATNQSPPAGYMAYLNKEPGKLYWKSSTATDAILKTLAVGHYRVTFVGMSRSTGMNAQVTAHGANPNRCNVSTILPSSTKTDIEIRCYTPAGVAAESDFHLMYTARSAMHAGIGAHMITKLPADPATTYNSLGLTNTFTGDSFKEIDFGGMSPAAPGVAHHYGVMATPVGTSHDFCNLRWASWTTELFCFNKNGSPSAPRVLVSRMLK